MVVVFKCLIPFSISVVLCDVLDNSCYQPIKNRFDRIPYAELLLKQ